MTSQDQAQWLSQGLNLHQQGQLENARHYYLRVLEQQPEHVSALHLLGVTLAQEGRLQEAVTYFERALAMETQHPEIHNNLGNALASMGLHQKALLHYDQAIEFKSDYADAWSNRGVVLQALARDQEALRSYEQAVTLGHPDPQVLYHCAALLQKLGFADKALQAYQRLLQLQPHHWDAHYNLGNLYKQQQAWTLAQAQYQRVLQNQPGDVRAWMNLGNVYKELSQYEQAITCYEKVLKRQPLDVDALYNVANVRKEQGDWLDALKWFDQAVACGSQDPQLFSNRGVVLRDLQRVDEAIESYEHALRLQPDLTEAQVNLSHALMLRGDWQRALALYERRWADPTRSWHAYQSYPQWTGKEPLEGQTILVHAEQGLGDTLQFCRYVTVLAHLGARVVLQVPAVLQRLLTPLPGVALCVSEHQDTGPFDWHIPMMSLTHALGVTPEHVGLNQPYLHADPQMADAWNKRLAAYQGLRVGLVWNGGFRAHQPHLRGVNDRRNLPLSALKNFRDVPAVFVSLQKGEPALSQLRQAMTQEWEGPALFDEVDALHDFADTAALVSTLDLVISVDTSTAHLAAAMGKPVWLLNRFDTCWRWMLHRSDTPWYPTMRIYRQHRWNDWTEVMQQVKQDLCRVVNGE